MSKPHSRPFGVVTIYRPPDSSSDFLSILKTNWKRLIMKIRETAISLIKLSPFLAILAPNLSIIPVNWWSHTLVTKTFSTLIDYFITNEPGEISKCGAIHTGTSDHNIIYGIRKINVSHKDNENIIAIRNINWNVQWAAVFAWSRKSLMGACLLFFRQSAKTLWEVWKQLLQVLDKHAPLQSKN